MRRIIGDDDVAVGLAALIGIDPRLVPIAAIAGPVPLRRRPPGFDGLARIVVAQQVSASAASSIWARVEALLGGPATPAAIDRFDDAQLAGAGLSRAKIRTLRAIAAACRDGLDLETVAEAPVATAIGRLVTIKGIGVWTAEVWLLFAAGHPDVWPGGDLALRAAVEDGLALPERPDEKACRAIADAWAPWRGVAARLFWAYYAARRQGREGVAT